MNNADDILKRLRGRQPSIDHPDELTERIMDSLPDRQVAHDVPASPRRLSPVWRWVAAACLLACVGVGAVLFFGRQGTDDNLLAEADSTHVAPPSATPEKSARSGHSESSEYSDYSDYSEPLDDTDESKLAGHADYSVSSDESVLSDESGPSDEPEPSESATYTPRLYSPLPTAAVRYASHELTPDTLFQPPSRMDEFIAKMAAYNNVEGVPLECAAGERDTTVVSTAYVFPDRKEVNVFGRLLQAACSYADDTPGYLLNYSHQQLFFTLDDPFRRTNYLWIAERISGERILLFCTHSPYGAATSAACFQTYREKISTTAPF